MSSLVQNPYVQPTDAAGGASSAVPDVNSLRLPQDFAATVGVKPLLVNVPVTKPRGQATPGFDPRATFVIDPLV